MNKIHTRVLAALFVSTVSVAMFSAQANAQSALQNTNNSTMLQPQTAQTQASGNTQNDVNSTIQNNKAQSALDQPSNRSLSVYSSPGQQIPDAVVQPADNLRAERTERNGSPWLLYALIVILVITVAGVFIRHRSSRVPQIVSNNTEPAPAVIRPEPLPKPKKRKKSSKKKRKSPHQR